MSYNNSVEKCRYIVARDLSSISNGLKRFTRATRNNPNTNPWRRIIVGIVTCKKYEKRLNNFLIIFGDIFAQLGLDYYLIHADPELETKPGLDYVVDHESRVFIARATESYETLAHKLAIFYSYVLDCTGYDYVVKVDDGCLLNLKEVIGNLDKPYVGATLRPTLNTIHRGKCTNDVYNGTDLDFGHGFKELCPGIDEKLYQELYRVKLAGGGYGYRINRDALRGISKYKAHTLTLGLSYEDVLLGQILYLEGITVTRADIGRYHYIG